MADAPGSDAQLDFLSGGGEVGALMRAHDWSSSPLGAPAAWPQSLRSVVGLMLGSKFPMFVAWGDELGFLYNDSYAEILGAKHPAALGARFREIWAEIWNDIAPLIDAALAGEASYHEDLPLVLNRSGLDEQAWFTFSYSPVRAESGRIAGMFCAVAETTDAVLAGRRRDALLALDDRLRRIEDPAALSYAASEVLGEALGATRVGYGVVDPDAGTIAVEENWRVAGYDSVAGVHRSADYGSYFEELRRGETVAVTDVAQDPRTSGEPEAFRALGIQAFMDVPVVENGRTAAIVFVHSATPRRWTEDEVAFVRGAAERTRAAIARRGAERSLRTINEELESRVVERTAALSESQRRFRGIFDSALQFMALLTPDGLVVEVNQTALAWSEIEPEDIVGKPFWLAAPMRENLELQAAVEEGIRRAAAGETVRAEHEMRGAGEARAFVDFSLKPVPGEDGAPVWLVAEGRDITALKEAQEALRQSQKMEAMGQLTGGVAHDFNNLLTPIVGVLDMLQRSGIGGEREQRLIGGAVQSADRATTLVQRLLAFARRQPLQPSAVDLGELTRGMADLIASTTGPQIRVAVNVPAALPPAMADANQLEMAILNLAVNARDAMPDGGTLRITLDAETVGRQSPLPLKPGRYVCLSVADTGVGMDEATLARAIEPFFSTKGIGKGTGLGLSMVHGLATQLGGALAIHSAPGMGTNVELWLPQGEAEAGAVRAAPVTGPLPRARGSVLLVDDEDVVRLSTADMLIELGYDVTEASSGEEALRLIDRGLAPDLLVTDHLMPGMTGAELAGQVQRTRAGLKVLVVSGYAEVDGLSPDLPRLTKPFKNAELAASIAALS